MDFKLLKNKIADDKLPEVIGELIDYSKEHNHNIENELILIANKLKSFKSRIRKGIIDPQFNEIEKSKLNEGTLSIIDQLEAENKNFSNIKIGKDNLVFFSAPVFVDAVERNNSLVDIKESIEHYPIISVEGLSGTGKTYLVSMFVQQYLKAFRSGDIVWYEPESDETINDFYSKIGLLLNFSTFSDSDRAKEILQYLISNKCLDRIKYKKRSLKS